MTSLGNFVTAALRVVPREAIDGDRPDGIAREVVWGELVLRIARGDSSALETLINETKPLVFARALRILGSRADAEETTADVYSQIWKT
jgi:hypothetical protein